MAKLTKEQYIEKINSLNEKYERIELRHSKKLLSIDKEFEKNLKKCPYEESCIGGTVMVTEELLRKHREFDIKCADSDYEESMKLNRWAIMNAQEQLDKILAKENKEATYKERSTPIPELLNEIKGIVDEWAANESSLDDTHKYYSKMDDNERMNFVIKPLAEDITYRAFNIIGKMKRFSEINFIYGKVDMYCFNENGSSCHLYATIVNGHERTNSYGTTFDVRPHIRTITT